MDTLTSFFDDASVVGVSISLLGNDNGQFLGVLKPSDTHDNSAETIFSPGKKRSWKLEGPIDSLNGNSLKLKHGGTFFLLADNTPPTIKAVKPYRNVKAGSRMVFKIADNTGIISWPGRFVTAIMDDQLFFPDYNPLRKEISFHAPIPSKASHHNLQIILVDESGNENLFRHQFNVRR